MAYRYWVTIVASTILGVVFLASGLGKLLGQGTLFLGISQTFPVLNTLVYDWLPWAELVLGLCLVLGIVTQPAAALSIVLIGNFIFYNSWMIIRGFGHEPCVCFGIFGKFMGEVSTVASLYIDVGLLILALAVLLCYSGSLLNRRPWFIRGKPKD